jgi:tetratricopeptide (TPR) repeat protein
MLKRLWLFHRPIAPVAIGMVVLLSVGGVLAVRYNRHEAALFYQIETRVDSLLAFNGNDYSDNKVKVYERLEMAKALLVNSDYPALLGRVYMREAALERRIHQYDEAVECCQEAITAYEKVGDRKGLAEAYYLLGDSYKKMGELDSGFKATLKGLELNTELADKQGIRRCYNNIGSFYKYMGQFEKALTYYQKSLALCQELDYRRGILSSYNNIGTIYQEMDKDELALEFYMKSYDVEVPLNHLSSAIYYGNIGGIMMKMGRNAEAKEALLKAGTFHEKGYEPRSRVTYFLHWGEYYQHIGKCDSSLVFYQNALTIAYQYQLNERMLHCYEKMALLYSQLGNFKQAYTAQMVYVRQREKVFGREKALDIARMEMDFETSKAQMLRENERVRSVLLFIILVLTIVSFGMTVMYNRNKHRSIVSGHLKKQESLVQEKEQVETDLNERNRELAFYSMQMIQQSESTRSIVSKLQSRLVDASGSTRRELTGIIGELEKENAPGLMWEEFEKRFIDINPGFYHRLIFNFPSLSQNEKRLCAFLKLNMSTKEISSITGQSPHSINVARTRLRRKLGLANSDVNICDFITEMQESVC